MGLLNLSRVCFTLFPFASLALALFFSSFSFASQPRIFIESTGAIGHTPRLIGIPAGWNYSPYSPDASLGKISPHGSVIQPSRGLTAKVGSPLIPNALVNSSIEIKSAGLKKAMKSNSKKGNALFTLASFAAFMIDEGWFLDDNGVLMMENEECDVLYRGNTSPPLSGDIFPYSFNNKISIRRDTVTFNSFDEHRAYLDEIIPFLNDYSLSNSRISSDSVTPCPVSDDSDVYGCVVLFDAADVFSHANVCLDPSTDVSYPATCGISIDIYRVTSYYNKPVSSLDYLILPNFEQHPRDTVVSPYKPFIMNPPYVRYTAGEPICTVVDVVVPQSEIDAAIDSNNFIVQMVDLSKMQFDNSDLLLLEEDMSVLVEDIDLDDVEPVIETETDNVTGDVTVTESITDLDVSFSNNPSSFPGLNFDVTDTTNKYKDGALNSSTSTNTSHKPPSSPPVGGGSTGGGFIDCEFMPTACAFMDWFKDDDLGDDPDLSSIMKDDEEFERTKTISFGAAVCPPPHTIYISALSMSVDLSFDFFCQFAEYAKALILAAAYIFAAYISLGVARRG